MFEHLSFLLDHSTFGLDTPSMRGCTPLDVAAASLIDNNELSLQIKASFRAFIFGVRQPNFNPRKLTSNWLLNICERVVFNLLQLYWLGTIRTLDGIHLRANVILTF